MRAVPFVVRAAPEESDLTALSAQRWQWLSKSLGLARVEVGGLAGSSVKAGASQELWLGLIVIGVVLMLAELAVARMWLR